MKVKPSKQGDKQLSGSASTGKPSDVVKHAMDTPAFGPEHKLLEGKQRVAMRFGHLFSNHLTEEGRSNLAVTLPPSRRQL